MGGREALYCVVVFAMGLVVGCFVGRMLHEVSRPLVIVICLSLGIFIGRMLRILYTYLKPRE